LTSSAVSYEFFAETLNLAGAELMARQGQKLKIETKRDASLVTEADLASERVILAALRKHFPDDLVLSEEAGLSSQDRRPGTYIWIIDPLDGTTNYANGYPFYCISMARGRFREDGRIESEVGAVFDAARGRLYHAAKGEGATVDGKKIQVVPPRDFAQGFLCTGFYYMKGTDLTREIERFARVAQRCQSIRRDGAAALDLALVAEGIFDAFWETGLAPWDVAAGNLLVREAGGKVRNYVENLPEFFDLEDATIIAGSPSAVESLVPLL
jgi:myo-inositol-1(or 4)-monophosphatase